MVEKQYFCDMRDICGYRQKKKTSTPMKIKPQKFIFSSLLGTSQSPRSY